ncbi:Arginase family enzyme [Saccharicrinis carchari]|uniref:Arginase family enzyme n=2 Tax=Saccharicrinis carchari TaxID=1168039 RepID=A0A521CSG8_SACCC|nr:Arginase family enzyme [Saccharicrinis carchari]
MPLEDTLGNQIVYGIADGWDFNDLKKFEVAIVGLADDKNAPQNQGCSQAVSTIRDSLSALRKTSRDIQIVDLGNLKGKTLNDRYFALAEVTQLLSASGLCMLLVGGGQDYVLPLTKGLARDKNDLSVTIVDAKLDFCHNGTDFSAHTFLSELGAHYNKDIFELNILGAQNYLLGESQVSKMNRLGWECVRLKELRGENIDCAEPFCRDAELFCFDVGAIQQSYLPYYSNININGFTGYEACQLAWYAGAGATSKAFCLSEYNPTIDKTGKGSMLCAEIIWHFLDAKSQYTREIPKEHMQEYKISVVHLHDFDVHIRFYSNRLNNRWWIEVPWKNGIKLLACSKKDYLKAQSGELPDKWWKFYKKQNQG